MDYYFEAPLKNGRFSFTQPILTLITKCYTSPQICVCACVYVSASIVHRAHKNSKDINKMTIDINYSYDPKPKDYI